MLHVKFLWKICLMAILQRRLLTPTLCFTVPLDCVTFAELSIQKLSSLLLSLCFPRHTELEAIKSPLAILSPAPQKLLKNRKWHFSLSISFCEDFLFTGEFFKKKKSLFSFHIPIPAPTASLPPAPPSFPHPFPHPSLMEFFLILWQGGLQCTFNGHLIYCKNSILFRL